MSAVPDAPSPGLEPGSIGMNWVALPDPSSVAAEPWNVALCAPKPSDRPAASSANFFWSTLLIEYRTTKSTNSRVNISAYDTSQRSWLTCSSCSSWLPFFFRAPPPPALIG
jgi:hypothetical protein